MKGKGKLSESLKTGVVVVVFLLLIVQFVFFAIKIVESLRASSDEEVAQEVPEAVASVSDSVAYGNSFTAGRSSSGGSRGSSSQGRTSSNRSSNAAKDRTSSEPGGSTRKKEVEFSLPPLEQPVSLAEERKQTRKIDLNSADSAQLVSLYGIGPYFAKNILKYRKRLGGSFASTEQLMDIQGIDSARFVEFADRIYVDTSLIRHLDLYTFPYDSLAKHPYIGSYAAKGVERYRKLVTQEEFSVDSLVKLKILTPGQGARIKMYTRE